MSIKMTRDYFDQITPPELVLCKANRERIGTIVLTECTYDRKFNDLDQIIFTTPLYLDDGETRNPVYEKLDVMKYIEAVNFGVFYIDKVDINSEGTHEEKKTITATSREGLLAQKYLDTFYANSGEDQDIGVNEDDIIHDIVNPEYQQIPFYNPLDPSYSLLNLILDEKCPEWTIDHVDAKLRDLIILCEVSRQDIYSFLMDYIAEHAECFFIFDTLAMTISAFAENQYGIDTNIVVTYDNLLQNTDISCDLSNIKTCLTVTGAEDLNLREVNLGFDALYDLSFYNSTEYMSENLYLAYNAWIEKYNSYTEAYNQLLVQHAAIMQEIYELETKMPEVEHVDEWLDPELNYPLATIKNELKQYGYQEPYYDTETEEYEDTSPLTDLRTIYQQHIQNRKSADDPKAWTHVETEQLDSPPAQFIIEGFLTNGEHFKIVYTEISGKPNMYKVSYTNYTYNKMQDILNAINAQIETTKAQLAALNARLKQVEEEMDEIQEDVAVENCFTEEEWKELSAFIREDELSTDEYIVTDEDDEEERLNTLMSFMEFAKKELKKVSVPQLSFSSSLVNLFVIPEFANYRDNLDVGNYIHVSMRDDYDIKVKITEINLDFFDMSSISFSFANIVRKEKNVYTDIQDVINAATSAATSLSYNSGKWQTTTKVVTDINKILHDGLLDAGAYLKGTTDTTEMNIDSRGIFVDTIRSSDGGKDSIFLGGGRILFSTDDWTTVREAIGRVMIEDEYVFGVLADAVVAGKVYGCTLKGNDIIGGTLASRNYVSGTTGTKFMLDDGTFEINSGGQKALWLDSNGNLNIRGKINATGGTIANWNIGNTAIWYGNENFGNANGMYFGTSGLSIKDKFKVSSSGVLTATGVDIDNATIKGDITATTGKIGGWTINGNQLLSSTIVNPTTADERYICLDGGTGIISFSTASIYGVGNSHSNGLYINADYIKLNALDTVCDIITATSATLKNGITVGGAATFNGTTTFKGATYINSSLDTYSTVNFHNNNVWFEKQINAAEGMKVAYPGTVSFDNGSNDLVCFWCYTANEIAVSTNTVSLNDVGKFRAQLTNTSDIRYKKIEDETMDNALDFIMNLKPFVYKWDNYGEDTQYHMGFGAQQVEYVLNSLKMYDYGIVDIPDNPNRTLGLSYSEFIAPLVKVVQDQQRAIEELKAKIERIENA